MWRPFWRIWFRVVFFWCKSKCRLTEIVRFSTLFILLHLGLLLALAVTTAIFAIKAPTRPSRTLTGARAIGLCAGLESLGWQTFIKVGTYRSGGIYLIQNKKSLCKWIFCLRLFWCIQFYATEYKFLYMTDQLEYNKIRDYVVWWKEHAMVNNKKKTVEELAKEMDTAYWTVHLFHSDW